MPTLPRLKGSKDARDMLANYLSQLNSAPSHWYLINNDNSSVVNEYDLSQLLGMSKNEYDAFLLSAGLTERNKDEELEVKDKQWESFASQFDKSVVEYTTYTTTISAISPKKRRFYVIRIGDKRQVNFGGKQNTFPNQLQLQKKGNMLTPRPPRALQRHLLRGVCDRIIATILREKDLYEEAMKALDELGKKKPAAAEDCTSSTQHPPSPSRVAATTKSTTSKTAVEASTHATPATPTLQSGSHIDAPPPTKKQRVAVSPDNSTSTYSVLKDGVAELHSMLNEINSDDLEIEKQMDKLFASIVQLKQSNRRIEYKDINNKGVSLLRVPVATTDKSYQVSNDWVLQALDINGKGDTESSSRRIIQQLIKTHGDAAHAALEKGGIKATKQLNATQLAAMFKDANVNNTQQRTLLKHLRDHYGKKAYASLAKVDMFCEGATPVNTGSIEYSYEEGDDGVKETIDYAEKNIALEVSQQLGSALTTHLKTKENKVLNIKKVDVVLGGDHGCGAFVVGAKVIVRFTDESSQCFDISVAEVNCRKDNAEILEKTILDELTKGLKTMVDNKLHIIITKDGDVKCIFGDEPTLADGSSLVKSLDITLYVTGDLAFYAMILGKEGMSGHWCHLCKLSRSEFVDLAAEGFRTVKYLKVRAKAMSRAIQIQSHSGLNEQIKGVHERASTKSQSNNDDSKRKERVERRIAALVAYESTRAGSTNE